MRKTGILILILIGLCAGAYAQSDDKRFVAELERDVVSLGNPVYLNLTFYGSQNIEPVSMPDIEGLKIRYVGPSTRISIVNGRSSQSISHAYLIIPGKEGDYQIGPFSVTYDGIRYSTRQVMLKVSRKPVVANAPGAYSGNTPQVSGTNTGGHFYYGDRVFLEMSIPRNRIYINEIVPLTIKMYVDNLSLKDIEYPSFDHEGFSLGPFEDPVRSKEFYKGMQYDVLIFKRNIFAVKDGDYKLGPANVKATAIVRQQKPRRSSMFGRSIFDDDFFSGLMGSSQLYPVEVSSDPVNITVLPFPEKGKPENFAGAVGNYNMDTVVEPQEVKVGDPITVKTVIYGTGNLDTVSAPVVTSLEGFKTYEPQVIKKDNKKVYEQVFIPKNKEVEEIPPITFSYFNTKLEKYMTLTSDPVSIKVLDQPEKDKGVKVVSGSGNEQLFFPAEKLGRDIVHIKTVLGPVRGTGEYLYFRPVFWIIQVLVLVFFTAGIFVFRYFSRIKTDKRFERYSKASGKAKRGMKAARKMLSKGDLGAFYDNMFRTLQDYLGDKFGIAKGNITANDIVSRIVSVPGSEEAVKIISKVFMEFDMARYASGKKDKKNAEHLAENIKKVIDIMEKMKI